MINQHWSTKKERYLVGSFGKFTASQTGLAVLLFGLHVKPCDMMNAVDGQITQSPRDNSQ